MKNLTQIMTIAILIFLFNLQQTAAQPIFSTSLSNEAVNDSEIEEELSFATEMKANAESDNTTTLEIASSSISANEFTSSSDFEAELRVEEWMVDLGDEKWSVEVVNEEELELEKWMLAPDKWLP